MYPMNDKAVLIFLIAFNFSATVIYSCYCFFVLYHHRLSLDKAAIFISFAYLASTWCRSSVIATVMLDFDINRLENNDIYIMDLNFIYISYLGLYIFAFQMREVYLHMNSQTALDFFRKKAINRQIFVTISIIMMVALALRDFYYFWELGHSLKQPMLPMVMIPLTKFVAFITDSIVFAIVIYCYYFLKKQ